MNRLYNLKCWLQENRRNILLIFFSLGAVLAIISSQICVVFNKSPSVPYSVCLQVYNCNPQKGDLCAINYNGRKLIKYVAGVEGDVIRNIYNDIWIENIRVGKAKKTAVLSPVKAGVVPKGYVFVIGTHPLSLDSRYNEFGLVKTSDIRGTVFGLIEQEK